MLRPMRAPQCVSVLAVLVSVSVAACGPGPRQNPGDDDGNADGGPTGDGSGGSTEGTTYVFAHTSTELYKVDPDSYDITLVAEFDWPGIGDEMTDLAIDKTGRMIGLSFGAVYNVDPLTAKATRLSYTTGGQFNGMSFVPADMVGRTGDDVLVATRNEDGQVFEVNPATGDISSIGDMGQYVSSGDLCAVVGFGTAQTVEGSSSDVLVKLAPPTFTAQPAPGATGFGDIWGVAFWKNKVFGFTDGGQFILVDPATGAGTVVKSGGPRWWGAAVTTVAPVVQ